MEVRVDLARIIISETRQDQIIVLKERDGDRSFPIVIGLAEALAIDRRVKGQEVPRPMTHDLIAGVIKQLQGDLKKIVINDLRDHTFHAKLVLRQDGRVVEVDSRPSDAIALVAGSDIPLFVEEKVLREACREPSA